MGVDPFLLAEDIVALWTTRQAYIAAPHIRLTRLVAHDERIDAYLDALSLTTSSEAADLLLELAASGEPAAVFAVAALGLAGRDRSYLWERILPSEGTPADGAAASAARPLVAALAWTAAPAARSALDPLIESSCPLRRAIAVAAFGARRTALPQTLLEHSLADPEPAPRARACRVIGQLGAEPLRAALAASWRDTDPECRFWSAWSAARLGSSEPLGILAEIARGTGPYADTALEMLLRRVTVDQGNAWLGAFARNLPDRRRSLVRATGIIGDPLYIPWLLACMEEPDIARLAGEAVSIITGIDIAYLDMDRAAPDGFSAGPSDDAADDNVLLDEDDWLPWPDPRKIGAWWARHASGYRAGTAYFLGRPKQSADWLGTLNDGFQRQRLAASLELAIRQPAAPMFEARARGRAQRAQLSRAAGGA